MADLLKRLDNLLSEAANLRDNLHLPEKQQRLLELEDIMQQEGFWNDQSKAQSVSQEYNQLKEFFTFWQSIESEVVNLKSLIESNTDESSETIAYLENLVAELEKQYNNNRLLALLSRKYDNHNAIFAIHAGAGGTDAQDWAETLDRKSTRLNS